MNTLMYKINEAANNWNKTREEKYKIEWYKLIEEYARQYKYPRRYKTN